MKKRRFMLLTLSLFIIFSHTHQFSAADEPAYAKWGRVAMTETKAKFPEAEIIDYLHVGRENGLNISKEIFKLWLKDKQKEFGVFVHISFHNQTEKMIDITFQVTDR